MSGFKSSEEAEARTGGAGMLRLEGWMDGRTGGRRGGEEKGGVEGSGVSGRAELGAHEEIFLSPGGSAATSRLSVAARGGPVPGGMRGAGGGGKPRSWVGPAQGPPPAVGDSPPGTSPIPTPLSFLSAWRAEASPINFIFLLICSPFRNSGSTDLSLPPSQK